MSSLVYEKSGDGGGGNRMGNGGRAAEGESWMYKTKDKEWKYEEEREKKTKEKEKDPYSEIELYLRKAQEEISAVFGEGGLGSDANEDTNSRPRTYTRPFSLDGQASPSKIRKVYTNDRQIDPPPPPRRQLSTPPTHPRRRVPLTKKSRRVSAPTLVSPRRSQNGQSPNSSDPWQPHRDPHLHEWAQGLLKDFNSFVEEEIRSLGKNTSTTASTPNLGRPSDYSIHQSSLGPIPAANSVSNLQSSVLPVNDSIATSYSRANWSKKNSLPNYARHLEYPTGRDVVDNSSLLRLPPRSSSLSHNMGTSQSTGRGDSWVGERAGPFKTYTLPRSGGHRSVSLSGAGAISYRSTANHPDDSEVNCELLRVNPRFSRSHSLDEGAGLSSWAVHHLSVIDSIHGKVTTPANSSGGTSQATLCSSIIPKPSEPKKIPAPPPSTPILDTSSYLDEGHYGKIRKTGFSEKHNERWRPTVMSSCHQDGFVNGSQEIAVRSNGNSKLSDSPCISIILPKTSNGTSALSPSDLEKDAGEPWEWADQEDACSLSVRQCDPNECSHCQTKKLISQDEDIDAQHQKFLEENPNLSFLENTQENAANESNNQMLIFVSVNVTPPESRENNMDSFDLDTTLEETPEMTAERACRKSEPALLGAVSASTPVDGRRHTLPAPRLFGNLSFLQAPVPTFDTSSWETLPPADELDFELEEKPISATVEREPSPGSLSAGSSRSLNSSLSSLSHLSIHPDHSECDSWPSSPVGDQNLTPDVFLDPLTVHYSRADDIKEENCITPHIKIYNENGESEQQSPETTQPITGMLHLTPIGCGGNEIIFSVSIPENARNNQNKTNSLEYKNTSDQNGNDRVKCENLETDSCDLKENQELWNGLQISDLKSEDLCSRVNSMYIQHKYAQKNIPEPNIDVREEPLGCSPANLIAEENERKGTREAKKGVVSPSQRQRSISLTEPPTTLALNYHNRRHVTMSTHSQGPEAIDDFLRAVESRIRRGSADQPPQHLPYSEPNQHPSPSSTPTSSTTPSTPTVVLDAFTQTTPTPTPQSASRASSVTWLSECGCDDLASIEPCTSSLALSVTEDDYGDDDDDEEEDWSEGVSISSSSPPPTPASMQRDDSSFSLSESLDTLDLNGESGIGTVSTRPSVSPPSHTHHAFDLSGSNLSSEDTGLENSFERQIRRYIPNNRSGRESEHVQHYRRRRPRPRHHEQWVRREDQMTQTDPHPPTHAHSIEEDTSLESYRESNETLERRSSGGSEERVVRHTHSEPHLDAPLTLMGGILRGVCSEAALPPLPTQSTRSIFSPSASTLPTLTEDKPPIAPINSRPPRPRQLSLSNNHHQQPQVPSKAISAPTLESKHHHHHHHHGHHTHHTPATTPSEESSGETPVLTTRSQSAKEIAELEAIEACKWLRAAGFPQYAQMYEELQFPLDLVCVERDHTFLDRDSLQALFRRLRALNRCAKIRLDSARKNKAEESDDEEQQCALSGNWKFQRHSRRWSRIVHDRSPGVGDKSGESRGLEIPEDAFLGQFKRSGSERLRDGAKAILRRMESLKNKKKKRQNRDGVVISGPKLVDEAHMQARVEELNCVDISLETSPELSACGTVTTGTLHPRDVRQSTPGEDSSSLASDQSQNSTPLFRGRRRRKFWGRGGSGHGVEGGGGSGGNGVIGGGSGGGGAYSDSECSPPTWRHYFTDANSNKMTQSNQAQSGHSEQQTNKGGSGRPSRPGHLRHTGSLTYGKDSQAARDNFLASIRAGGEKNDENASPLPSPDDERHSVYDNVPLIICNKSYHDYQPEVMDSASAHEGSGSSECTVESRESPLPSAHDDEEIDEPCQRRATVDRWHSFNRKSYQPITRQIGTQINGFSSGQMLHLRKRALLRLTALMERYCPSNRSGWNWELPKFMRKIKTPDYRDRQVFGVPLLVIAQRTGQPVPPGIQAALQYLRTSSLDQVGIFRKPGVRSRIQKLREFHELGEEIVYSNFGICDIADMAKTYFRELPEVLLTNKLSEMFIAIFQYLPVEHRLEALQCAVLLLPDENREVLMALLTFLADVAANSHHNQMHASNLAVCLAPSLFHLNVGTSGSSPLRRRAAGTPEQRDLHENKAAHQCLTLMIQQVSQLQCVPMEMLSNCRFTYLEQSQPVCLEDLGVVGSPGVTTTMEGDWASYMNACISALLKEARDKSRGWVHMNCADSNVEILYRKVGDGHPLRLWRATTEVEAPPSELLNRVIRERHLWDDTLLKWRVVTRLDRQAEVFQYMCNSMPPRPPVDYCVLRCWRSDLARGTCVVVETSVEHADAPVLVGGVRGIVLASRYLIQPCGSGKSRITHISRLDMRGRTPEWYNKVYGHATAMHLTRIRQSFQHHASGPESKV